MNERVYTIMIEIKIENNKPNEISLKPQIFMTLFTQHILDLRSMETVFYKKRKRTGIMITKVCIVSFKNNRNVRKF